MFIHSSDLSWQLTDETYKQHALKPPFLHLPPSTPIPYIHLSWPLSTTENMILPGQSVFKR